MFKGRNTAVGIGAFSVAAFLITAPSIAQAAEGDVDSFAEGRFLSATLADTDLAVIVDLDPATATNDGSTSVSEERNPLSATVLEDSTVAPGTVAVSDADGADAGVIGQYAIARDNGTSFASSGFIGANGAIGVSPASGATASVDLAVLLGDALPEGLSGLRLEAEGIAAEAEAVLGDYRGDYTLADARLVLDVPAIATTDDRTATALAPLQASLGGLDGPDGSIAAAVDQILGSIGVTGPADVDVSVDADVQGLIDSIDGTVLRDPALTVDLGTGTVTVDLAALPSGTGLNDAEPGTELVSDAVIGDITDGVDRLLSGYLDDLEVQLLDIVHNADVNVSAHVSTVDSVQTGENVSTVTTPVTQVIDAVTGDVLGTMDPATGSVTSAVPGISGDVLADLVAGVDLGGIGGLFGGGSSLPEVTTRVVADVSTVVDPVFSTFENSADVSLSGSLADFEDGSSVIADADATVLGAPVALDGTVFIGPIADALVSALLGSDSTAGGIADGLELGVLDPILGEVTGGGTGDESSDGNGGSISDLAGLVSVQSNVQSIADDGSFTQTALQVEILDGDVATVSLANATVGPNAVGSGGNTAGDPSTGGPGGPNGDPTTGFAADGTLAYTGWAGLGIALLAVLCIALGAVALWRSRAAIAAVESDADTLA